MRLAGKVVIVAGAGGGMGTAVPLLFAKEGAKVVVAARRAEPLQAIVEQIKATGGEASYATGDLTTEAGVQGVVDFTEQTYGRLDVMFNNLGDSAGRGLQLHETPMTDWNYLTDINLKAAYLCTRYAVPALKRAGRGVIIHLSASQDIRMRGHAGYGAAKAGLIGLTQNTALAYRKDNIRVVCLCPNSMGGDIHGDATDLPAPDLMRRGTAQDLAWAALFFASDEASWLTGLVVPVDGGNELAVPTPVTQAPPGLPALTRRQTVLIMAALMTATFLTALDLTVVGTAMPTIVGQMGGLSLYAWVFTAYALTSTTTVPLYGKLADLYGRLPVFYTGVTIFLLGSALCGVAQNMEQLILFRAVQGIGAGAVQPLVLTMIGDVFTVEQRARFNALFSTVWGVASIAGPAVGGLLTESVSWRFIFYINVPVGIVACLMLTRVFPEKVERRRHQLDFAGAGLLTAAIVALLLATSARNGNTTTDSAITVGLLIAAAVLLAAFVWQERRVAEPVVPLSILRMPVIAVAAVSALLLGGLSFATTSYLPLMVQGALGGTATLAGAMLIPLSIGWPIGSVFGGRIILRWGFRPALLVGVAFIALGCVPLALLEKGVSLWWVGLLTSILGLGLGAAMLATTIAVQNSVDWSQRGVATSVVFLARSLGGSLGVTALGTVLTADLMHRLDGMQLPVGGAISIGEVTRLLEPSSRAQLDAATIVTLEAAFSSSLQLVYVGVAAMAVAAVIVALRFPRVTVAQLSSAAGRK